jgi:hypothetical protein
MLDAASPYFVETQSPIPKRFLIYFLEEAGFLG